MLFILSCNVLSGYLTQFDGNSHCFNFDIIRDTAPLSSIYPVGVTSPVCRVTVEQLLKRRAILEERTSGLLIGCVRLG